MLAAPPACITLSIVCFADFMEVGIEGNVAGAKLDKETALSRGKTLRNSIVLSKGE